MVRIPVDTVKKEIRYLAMYDSEHVVRYDRARSNFFAVKEGNLLIVKDELESWQSYVLPAGNFALKLCTGYFELVEQSTYSSMQAYNKYASKSEVVARYNIVDKSNIDMLKRSIKDAFSGRVTTKNLSPCKYIDFDYICEYKDGIELKSNKQDALLFVSFRTAHFGYRRTKKFVKRCIELA